MTSAHDFEITAKIQNAHLLDRRMAEAPDIAMQEITKAMLQAELLFEAQAKEFTPLGVTGVLRGSIAAQPPVASRDGVLGVVGTPSLYAVPVELGTKPHFPPLEPIEDWVAAKLDVDADSVPYVALQIARKIAARGTEGAHMFERAADETQGQRNQIFANANRRILKRIAAK